MSFEEFKKHSRLYVIGALESEELEEFERARAKFGKKAEDFITECYGLHEAFALSLRPANLLPQSRTTYGDGAGTEGSLTHDRLPLMLPTAQFAKDKLLQKAIEVYLK
jgi:hypothetical protein